MSEKKMSEAQKRALDKYKANVKRLTIDFPPTDAELWEHIQKQPNKQGYIKNLIRADIAPATKTNADGIRDMTNEELADFLSELFITGACNDFGIPEKTPCPHNCKECILEWLNLKVAKGGFVDAAD